MKKTVCRCCGSDDLHQYLDLGDQPLANSYHKNKKLKSYPLKVNLCKSCFHSQLSEVVSPNKMFKNYLYVSGTTQTFQKHCEELAKDAVSRSKEHPRVLDVANNDGTLLQKFRDLGCEVQGVDPSVNLREITKEKNIPVEVGFWSSKIIKNIGKFDIITATNVFAHVDNIANFLKLIKKALNPEGFAIIEFPYCKDMIKKCEFDTIYHEHLSYFLVNSFRTLTQKCGFFIFDVIETPIHGSSIRFFICPKMEVKCKEFTISIKDNPIVDDLIKIEKEKGMLDLATYSLFETKVLKNKEDFLKEITYQKKYRKVIGYGASAKGNTMLNFFGIDLDYIVDDNPLKWDYQTPGRNIPIVSPEFLENDNTALAIVILSWNFSKEIISKIDKMKKGEQNVCLLYVPETAVLEFPYDLSCLEAISG